MKTSIIKLDSFARAAQAYLKEKSGDTKLSYAIKKVLERGVSCFEEYQELKEDLELELANSDEKGSVLFNYNERGQRVYQFTKEGLKSLKSRMRELNQEERFEIKEHICSDLPSDLSEIYIPAFEGFVIKKKDDDPA